MLFFCIKLEEYLPFSMNHGGLRKVENVQFNNIQLP